MNQDFEIRFGLSDDDSGVFGGVSGFLDWLSVAVATPALLYWLPGISIPAVAGALLIFPGCSLRITGENNWF